MTFSYVGGKPRKENKHDDNDTPSVPNKRGRGTNKTPVVGVMIGKIRKFIVKLLYLIRKGQKLTDKQLFDILNKVCKQDSNNTLFLMNSGVTIILRSRI